MVLKPEIRTLQDTLEAEALAGIDASVARAMETVDRLRSELIDRISRVREGSFNAQVLPDLLAALDEAVDRYKDEFGQVLLDGHVQAESMGQRIIDAPFESVGLQIAVPHVSVILLDALDQVNLDLVQGISDSLRAVLRDEIQFGTLGVYTPFETMERIRTLLETSEAEGRHGAAWRSEAIMRTETGRTLSQATQARLEEAGQSLEGMQKEWVHVTVRNPRQTHQAISGQRVGVNETFAVGGEQLRYPRDPNGSAGNTVFCRCQVRGWHPDFEE